MRKKFGNLEFVRSPLHTPLLSADNVGAVVFFFLISISTAMTSLCLKMQLGSRFVFKKGKEREGGRGTLCAPATVADQTRVK